MSSDASNSGARPSAFGLAPFAEGYEVGGLGSRLLGVPFPNQAFFREENLEGVNWVVCLDSEDPGRRYDPAPLQFLFRGKLDSPLSGNREAVAAVAHVAAAARVVQQVLVMDGAQAHPETERPRGQPGHYDPCSVGGCFGAGFFLGVGFLGLATTILIYT